MRPLISFSEQTKPKAKFHLRYHPLKHQLGQSQRPSKNRSPEDWPYRPGRLQSKEQGQSWRSIYSAHHTIAPMGHEKHRAWGQVPALQPRFFSHLLCEPRVSHFTSLGMRACLYVNITVLWKRMGRRKNNSLLKWLMLLNIMASTWGLKLSCVCPTLYESPLWGKPL